MSDDDELLFQTCELAANAVAVAQVEQGGWLVSDDDGRFDDQY